MQNDRNYDLIFSLGQACSCTSSLRNSHLQNYSYPFDWVYGSNFEGRMQILLDKFERFMEKNDLICAYYEKLNNHIAYKNVFNNLIFVHDFPADIEFEERYIIVKHKYDRRVQRLLDKIERARKILLVYLEHPIENNKLEDNQVLIANLNKIKKKFNKNFELLYFVGDLNLKPLEYAKEIVSSDIIKITGNYKDLTKMGSGEEHIVNDEFFSRVFKDYSLNIPLSYRIKKSFIKHSVSLIPFRSVRRKMRKRMKL